MQEQYRQSSLALLRAKKRTKSSDDPSFLEGSRRLVEFMYTCWQEQKCCDVLITSKGGNMHAHSVALGAYSSTLTETFYGFSNGDVIKLDLSDFRSDVVLNILHFLYTTELELNCHVIGQVLSCATELGLDIVVEMCMAYLEKVDVENAVLHYSIAENNALKELRDLVLDFLLTNFSKVSKTKHFVYMPYERLLAILKDDQLCVDEEIDMFHAVVHWVDFNRPTRIHHAYALLQCVRFVLMSAEVITSEVEPVDWIFEDRQSWREFLYEAMKFNALECVGSDLARKIKKEKRKCNQENGDESPTRRDREENGPIDEVSPRTSKTSKTQNGSPRASRTSNAESASTSKSKSRNTGSELIRKSLLNQQSSSPKQSEGQTSAGRNVSGSREEKKSSSAAERNSSQNRKSFEQDKRNTKSGNKRPQGKISSHVNNNSRNASRKNRHLRDKPPDSDVSNESLPVVKLGTNIRKKTNKDDPKKNIWMYEHAADGSLNQPNRGQPRSQSNYHHTAPSNNSNYRQTTQPNNSNYRRTTQQNKSNYHQITQPNNANLHQIKQPNNNSNFHQTDHLNYNPTAQLSNATKPVVWRQSQPPPKLIQPQTTGVTYHTQLSREVRSLSVNNSNITCQPMDDQQQPSNNIIIPRMATRRKINRDEKLEMLCVISIGGIDLESLDPDRPGRLVCNYSVDDNQWNVINNPMSTYLHHHGVAVVEDKLYVVGKTDSEAVASCGGI